MQHFKGKFIFAVILFWIAFSAACKGFVYRNVSEGMAPTLNIDDAFTANPFAYSTNPIQRFDIVVFDAPPSNRRGSNDERWIKRVIGLPGETIEMQNGIVLINGEKLEESFKKMEDPPNTRWKKDFPPLVIPNDEYFVLGDNRPNSEDSRFFKPPTIGKDKIRGKLVKILPGYYKTS